MLLSQQLSAVAQKNLSLPATRYLNQDLSYADFKRWVARLSYLYLNDLGTSNVRVAFLASNSPAYLATFLALSNIRAISIPLNPRASFEELAVWLKESKATYLAVSTDFLALARKLLQTERLKLPIIEFEKKQGGEYDHVYNPPPENLPKDTDPILLLRTAGVTGKPKLAAFDHRSVQHAAVSLRGLYQAAPGERIATPMIWYHPFAFFHGALFPLLSGLTCVVDYGLERHEFLPFLQENRVSRIVLSPELAEKLLTFCRSENRKLPGVKALVVGGGPVTEAMRKLGAECEVPILHCYGQTENAWTIALETLGDSPGARGLPGCKYKVVDANGDPIESKRGDRTGLLAVAGPSVMLGFKGLKKEEYEVATKLAIRGTWLYTGDVATLRGEGEELEIDLVGRREELVEREGRFVSPEPIDAVLKLIPGCLDGAGFAMRNGKQQWTLACAIVKDEKSLLKEEEVLARCRQELPKESVPTIVFFTEHIPRTSTGNIHRYLLGRRFDGLDGGISASAPASPIKENVMAKKSQPEVAAKAAPVPTKNGSERYVTCKLEDILIGEPLPVTLYIFLDYRFIPYRPKGSALDRVTYDRLEFKKIGFLFTLEEDLERMLAWSASRAEKRAPAEDAPKNDAFENARHEAHRELLEVFQTPPPNQAVGKILDVSKKLVTEVMKAPYAVKPLSKLQTYSKGTVDHSMNVSVLSIYLAMQMGYSHAVILQHVAAGGLLHDIGKPNVPVADGDSPETIDAKMQHHPTYGVAVLDTEPNVPSEVRMIVAQHHECYDGSGFPNKLRSNAIYDLTRIVSIVNVFEDLVAAGSGVLQERQKNAIGEMENKLSRKFDPQKLEKALKILKLGV